MKIVIIEDELPTAEYLQQSLTSLKPEITISAILLSVEESVVYFNNNPEPDLIFSDIHLGDGLSFDIFKSVEISCPVIFCTAYDEYALNAFKANAVDYLLKPFSFTTIKSAMIKFETLHQTMRKRSSHGYGEFSQMYVQVADEKPEALLVNYKDKIIPVRIADVAFFILHFQQVQLHTFDQKSYMVDKSLDELERLSGKSFFRVNRKSLVSRRAVMSASTYFSRRLSLNLSVSSPEAIIVSREKVSTFLAWLQTV